MRRFLRIKEVSHVTGLSRSTIYWQISKGLFPKPIKITDHRSGWASDQIEQWQAERELQSRAEAAA
jgi:prophage regulatory protein